MKILLFVIILCLLPALAGCFMLRVRRGQDAMAPLRKFRYAHRGLYDSDAGVPENSLPAFSRAITHGFGAELDVHLLRDGSLAVFHDSALARMTGRGGYLEDLSAPELSACFLGGTQESIPEFRDVLSLFEGTGLPLIVELKSFRGNCAALCARTMAELDRFHVPYCVESFDPRCVRWLRKHRPEVIRGQLSSDFTRDRTGNGPVMDFLAAKLLLNFYSRPDFIAYHFEDRRRAPLRLCRKRGAQLVYWTIRSRQDLDTAEREGAIPIFEHFLP